MTQPQLDNLVRIGRLKTEPAAREEIQGLVRSGTRRLNPEKGPWFWNHLDCTRAPYAIEMEWALLQWSRQINDGSDPELEREQETRLEELEHYLEQDPDSLEIKCHDTIRWELGSVGGVMQPQEG